MEIVKKVARKAVLIYPRFYGHTFWSFERTLAKYIRRNEYGLPKRSLPPLGLMGLYNHIKHYYDDIELIDRNVNPLPLEELIGEADHVYMGGMIAQQKGFLEDAEVVKNAGKLLIAGGTIVDEHSPLMALADHLVENEAEMVIDDMLDGLFHGNAEKFYRGTHTPPERFFQPDYSSINLKNYMTMSVQITRGCPFSCEFCDITARFGRKPRMAPWEHTENAFRKLFELGWRDSVFIVDDNLIGNPAKAIALLKRIHELETDIGYRSPKYSEVSVNLGNETPVMSELRRWFHKAYFVNNFFGVETNNAEALVETGKKQNLHGQKSTQEKLAFISEETGSKMMAGIIYGFDSDTSESVDGLIDFINSTHVPIVMVGLLQALPKTELWERMEKEGRLLVQATGNNSDGTMNFIPYNISEREAEQNYVKILRGIYSEEAYFARVKRALNPIDPRLEDVPIPNTRKMYSGLRSGLRILTKENSFTYWRYLKEAHKIARKRFGFNSKGYWYILSEYITYCARYTHMKAQTQYMEKQIESRDYEQWQTFSWKEFQEFQVFEFTMPALLQQHRERSL
ncbi:B12-binding domain-containing radical SAM protein [Candidatus Poribacteria bacterium]